MYAISTYCCDRSSSKPRYFAGADALLAITAVVLAVIVLLKCGACLNSIGETGAGVMLGAGAAVIILDLCRAYRLSKVSVSNIPGQKRVRQQIEGLSTDTTVLQIKERIQDKEGIPPNQQRLIFNGKALENDKPLGFYGITDESTLHLRVPLPSPDPRSSQEIEADRIAAEDSQKEANKKQRAEIQAYLEGNENVDVPVFIKTLTGRTINIDILRTHSTIADLKREIQAKEGIPPDQQRILYPGKECEDDMPLGLCGLQNGHTVHLVTRAPPPQQTAEEQRAQKAADEESAKAFEAQERNKLDAYYQTQPQKIKSLFVQTLTGKTITLEE